MKSSELLNDLAAVFRWTAKLNMHEGIANHLSVCSPEAGVVSMLTDLECILAKSKQAIYSLLKIKNLKK